ncbi:Outer membrane protein assembly factor BamA [Candidatus Providencia siddallii]|uniref:Outer membrane protein assembly factor BamA n=1 Tax=Candidatus Providencia siddallii TaxID=1715285 RepID=A0A0M6W8Z2_9GAMM|nr:Outer membrane protein assembly factor BamA [Candidatus Providencia siddallii]
MVIKKILIASLFITSINAYCSNKFIVKDIHLEGLQRISINTVLLNIPIKIGDLINNDDISLSIRNLFLTGNFEDIKVSRDGNSLFFQLKELPIISNISFKGNKYINSDIIKHNLDEFNIKIGETLNYIKILNIKKDLESFYINIGKFNTTIEPNITKLPRNRVNLEFIFSESKTAKIKQINIIGNKYYKTAELINKLQLRDHIFLWNIFANKKYQKQKLNDDLDRIKNFYLEQGYACFKINSTQINLSSNKKDIYITINIKEGKKYNISNIEIINNNLEYLSDIKKLLTIKQGSMYNIAKIINVENKIKELLNKYGYAYPQITIKSEINDENKTIKLYLNINPGKRFYVRNIYFRGNYITKDYVLRREIRQIEGTWLQNNLVELGKERLNRTGFFESVDIETQPVPNIIDQIDLIYKVKERNIGSINLGLGFGTESGISFQIGAIQNNWLGTGNEVAINANKNNYSTNIDLSFTDPYFTINGISVNNRFYYNNFNAKNADLSSFNNKIYGFENFFIFPFNEYNYFRIGPSYVKNNLSNMRPQASMWHYFNSMGIYPTINENGRNKELFKANEITLNVGWIFNSLDQNFFPTSGKKTNISCKVTTPGSDNKYYKIWFNLSKYYPLNNDKTWIFLFRGQTGYGTGFNNKQMPFFENFYAGGSNTIRGFRLNNIGPKAIYLKRNSTTGKIEPESNNQSNDAIGGNAIYTMTFELITPTPFIDEKNLNSIRTSIFIDAGTVWDTNWYNINSDWRKEIINNNTSKSIHASIGVALQWISPIGPLIFSYAQPIKNTGHNNAEQFQFNIGKTW